MHYITTRRLPAEDSKIFRKILINDPVYFSEYSKVLEDYRKENIIESVTEENEILSEDNCFYLPHRAVIREDKTTTRLRVVFDASSHSKGQLSLNDCLHTGFNLLPDLFLLLIRFRIYSVVVTADIKQAFLQIEIHEEDRNYTRFLWTADPENSNSGLDWDEIVPDEIVKIFNDWCDDLKKLSNIRITRHYFYGALPKDIHNIELHLFSDASIKAYGTVAYLRVELNDGKIITVLLHLKEESSFLKKLSLPRLELMGALFSARLSEKYEGLEFPVQNILDRFIHRILFG
ncbi:integrase catalytic domain-containing protein [Trichonephila inaurata madagascariensis]|uniref:Integrase catalytic domain-containing protein n=1 Tax=Trichonephila inaurata madagascariensis TaxID=2747483 RepID=A0A8X7C6H5_9ARAC|nr:integrase catalytic domain-containing protein [Trichonephila inaurata madagascariensis]